MAQKSGKAGQSTYEMANQRKWRGTLYLVMGIVAILVIYFLLTNAKQFGLGSGVLLALLFLMQIIPDIAKRKAKNKFKEEKRAIRGAKAEERVENILDMLDENYLVIHDVVSQYGNIDHLVISREAGIILIETKAHGGKVELINNQLLVNGKPPEKDFVAQVLRNTYWLRDQVETITGTKPWVTPILVFTNAFVRGRLKVKGITIINERYLIESMQKKNAGAETVWEKREEILQIVM